MDKMSLFSILTVSVPEAVLNMFIGFVLTGHRSKLYLDDKLNVVRFVTAVLLMTITVVLTRAILPSVTFVVIANIIIYSLIIKLIYNFKNSEALLCVIIFYGVLITIETVYGFPMLMIMEKNIYHCYSDDLLRFVVTIPERIIQLVIIISFWSWDLVYLNINQLNDIKKIFFSIMLMLFVSEAIFVTVVIYNIETLQIWIQVMCAAGLLLLGVVNFLFSRLIIKMAKHIYQK